MKIRILFILLMVILMIPVYAMASSGNGDFSLSYLYLDEEGNRSVNHSSFNIYEGAGISLENFKYTFNNGLLVNANLKNIILNNRNLWLETSKPGLFGVKVNHNQYRRIYNFSGTNYVRRHANKGSVWFYPVKNLKLWGGGSLIGRSGIMTDLFDPAPGAIGVDVDYDQLEYLGGFQFNHRGGFLRAEFRNMDFTDNENSERDKTSFQYRFDGYLPLPYYEWITINGGFRRFETSFDKSNFGIKSNRGWGGIRANLPENFILRYSFIFDRTASDSDYVATDNITNTVYLSHIWYGLAEITAGYQNGINDDFEDEVKSNSFYFSGWVKPVNVLKIQGVIGITDEEVKAGSRLIGDQTRNRYKFSLKYDAQRYGKIAVKVENKIRKNDQLGTRIDYLNLSSNYNFMMPRYGFVNTGYSMAKGEYENTENLFEFRDHTLYGDFTSMEFYGLTTNIRATYYRSQQDLDVESFILSFGLAYKFYQSYSLSLRYNAENFDDFLARDKYYTINILEINLTKHLSF